MKRFLVIAALLLAGSSSLFAQDSTLNHSEKMIGKKMVEYYVKKLHLSKDEAAGFEPVFLRSYGEWLQRLRNSRGDRLVVQQKINELRLSYVPQFCDILGKRRGYRVFSLNNKEKCRMS